MSHLPMNKGKRRAGIEIARVEPSVIERHRLTIASGYVRDVTGKRIPEGTCLSGRCVVVTTRGYRFTAIDFGTTRGAGWRFARVPDR